MHSLIAHFYVPKEILPTRAEVLIGLGIGLRASGEPSPMSEAVARRCAELYRRGVARKILLTGGYRQSDRTEAEAMHQVLLAEGLPADDILLETRAIRTHLNALYTLPICVEQGWRTIILVAQDIHARRAFAIFRKIYGHQFSMHLALARGPYERLPQGRLSSQTRFLLTWEIPAFVLAKLRRWA